MWLVHSGFPMIDLTRLFDADTLKAWEETLLLWEVERPFDIRDDNAWLRHLQKEFDEELCGTTLDVETVRFWRERLRPRLSGARKARIRTKKRGQGSAPSVMSPIELLRIKRVSPTRAFMRYKLHFWLLNASLLASLYLAIGGPFAFDVTWYWVIAIAGVVLALWLRVLERRKDRLSRMKPELAPTITATELAAVLVKDGATPPTIDIAAVFDAKTMRRWRRTIARWLRDEPFNVAATGEWVQRLQREFEAELQGRRLDSHTVNFWLNKEWIDTRRKG